YHGYGHLDTFAHRDPVQLEGGRWYFHRTRGTYRGGSFKGLDLAFGDGTAHAGVLLRGIEAADGSLIDGPLLLVDHVLDRTGATDVASLDRGINKRLAWEAGNPLHLVEDTSYTRRELLRTPRVGLSLKRTGKSPEPARYLMRSYRYLSQPKRTAKGKVHMILAMHARGAAADEIQQTTGCPRPAMGRYIADFEAGRQNKDLTPYFGKDLTPKDLCRLYGTWVANFGTKQ